MLYINQWHPQNLLLHCLCPGCEMMMTVKYVQYCSIASILSSHYCASTVKKIARTSFLHVLCRVSAMVRTTCVHSLHGFTCICLTATAHQFLLSCPWWKAQLHKHTSNPKRTSNPRKLINNNVLFCIHFFLCTNNALQAAVSDLLCPGKLVPLAVSLFLFLLSLTCIKLTFFFWTHRMGACLWLALLNIWGENWHQNHWWLLKKLPQVPALWCWSSWRNSEQAGTCPKHLWVCLCTLSPKCEPSCEPIFVMTDEKDHSCETFLHLWTFSKKIRELCPKASVVTNGFANRFSWTLLFVVSFFASGSQLWSFSWADSFAVHLCNRPKFVNLFWNMWTDFYQLALCAVCCGKFQNLHPFLRTCASVSAKIGCFPHCQQRMSSVDVKLVRVAWDVTKCHFLCVWILHPIMKLLSVEMLEGCWFFLIGLFLSKTWCWLCDKCAPGAVEMFSLHMQQWKFLFKWLSAQWHICSCDGCPETGPNRRRQLVVWSEGKHWMTFLLVLLSKVLPQETKIWCWHWCWCAC